MAVKHTFTSTIEDGADNTLVQPSDWNAEHVLSNALGAIDALTPAASKIPYFNGADSATLADITATGVSLLGVADAAAGRTALGLGTIATQAADNVSLTGGSISGMTSISGSTLTSTVATGTAPLSVTSTTLVTNLNTDTVDGFHASQTPAANQIPVLNSAGRFVLGGADDGSSKIQTDGVIKAKGLTLSDTNEIKWGDGSCKISGSGSTDVVTITGDITIPTASSYKINNISILKHPYGDTSSIAVGYDALANVNTSTLYNTAVGRDSLKINTNGSSNTAVGHGSLVANTTGNNNVAVGRASFYNNTTGNDNTTVGRAAMLSNTEGSRNTSIGYSALYSNTTGNENTAIGYVAGRYLTNGTSPNETGNNSLFLGSWTKANADGESNQIVIGYDATGLGSNSVVLGNSEITKTALRGTVLVNTTTDDGVNKLQVNGGTKASQYRLSALNTAPASASATGTLGEVRITADAIYVCTATNTWKKVAIATW